MTPIRVDARGLRCPWPVLRLARAMRDAPEGAAVHIDADDPAASGEIAALAAERGWSVTAEGPASWLVRRPDAALPATG